MRIVTCSKGRSAKQGAVWMVVAALALAACSPAPGPTATVAPTVAAPETVLNIYNWDTYIDPTIVADFEQEYGVTVNYETYGSNEEMFATLEAGPTDYDLVVPTDYMVEIMLDLDMLAPLDSSRLPNSRNLDSAFASPAFDPGTRYCMPYQWGTIGIGYNAKAIARPSPSASPTAQSAGQGTDGRPAEQAAIDSWADLFDPAFSGRVSLLADSRDALGVALLMLGYSPNTTSPTQIAQARDFLINHAAQIAQYAPDTGQDLLAAGEVDLAMEYSGDIFQLMAEDPDIRYVIPREGSLIWIDSICIPSTAPHKDLAHKFIDYLLQAQVGAALSNYTHYGSPNLASRPLLIPADRDNPAIYPPAEVQQRLFSLADLGIEATEMYEQAWQQVLAAHSEGQ